MNKDFMRLHTSAEARSGVPAVATIGRSFAADGAQDSWESVAAYITICDSLMPVRVV